MFHSGQRKLNDSNIPSDTEQGVRRRKAILQTKISKMNKNNFYLLVPNSSVLRATGIIDDLYARSEAV